MTRADRQPSAESFHGLDPDITQMLDDRLFAQQENEAALIARVKECVMAVAGCEPRPRHRTVRAADAGWQQVAPGVERKFLWQSGDAMSCLVRLAPGACVDGHAHPIDEECVVLEGSLRIGADLLLLPGDFHVGVQGVPHLHASTDTGAVVYLRGARVQVETST